MDDGSKQTRGYALHTESFSKEEVEFLSKILRMKFGLKTTLHVTNKKKGQYSIYIWNRSENDFKEMIRPYIEKSMIRKL